MEIRFLGCHHTESLYTRLATLLVDDILALDAAAITSTLTSEEQERIQAVFISHGHYDHMRDIPTLALAGLETGVTIPVLALAETLDLLKRHLLNGKVYPDFTQIPTVEKPRLQLIPLEPWKEVEVCGFKITPAPAHHALPALGYHVTSSAGGRFFYTGDIGSGLDRTWGDREPDLLILEVTFPNSRIELARRTDHLTPELLERELLGLLAAGRRIPPIIAVHMNTLLEEQIHTELDALATRLGIAVTLAHEGMVVEV